MPKNEDIKISHTFAWLFKFTKKYRVSFLLSMFLVLVMTAINMSNVWYIQIAVAQVADSNNNILNVAIILLCILILGTLITYISGYVNGKMGACIARDIKGSFSHKIMSLTQSSKDQLNSGDIISRFNYDIGTITSFIPSGIFNLLFQIFMALSATIYMLYVNWFLLLISIVFIPVSMFIVNVLRKKISSNFMVNAENIGKANAVAMETINNINIVKSYNMQETMFKNITVFYKESLNCWIKIHKLFSPMLMLNIMMRELPRFICISVGGYLALNGYLHIENLIGFILLLGYVVDPITNLPNLITPLSNTGASIKRVETIFDMPDEREDGIILSNKMKDSILIELKNIRFGYNENKEVLHDISLQLRAGEKIALVGKSGSGKSSIIKLISGFYNYTAGDIIIYSTSYNKLSLKSIRRQLALVSQDVTIFPYSLSDNIAFGSEKSDITKEEIVQAAKHANAHDFIMSLPDGYDTILMENGANLSGGQKQMISIARAFLKDSPIILLDEPTSALDTQSESVITDSLNRLMQDKGVIIVSHRLNTIMNADRILVLDKGQIVEEGTHMSLIEQNSLYKKLYLAGFEDSEELRE
jgi:ABC-type multidrug transport system fused ATPase/permease subunit